MKLLYQYLFIGTLLLLSQNVLSQNIYYASTNINFRTKPSEYASKTCIIPYQQKLKVYDLANRTWALVKYNGTIGYVKAKYLRQITVAKSSKLITHKNISRVKPRRQTYINCDGIRIQSPTYSNSAPNNASAVCNDGTYSFSKHRRGTCSGHGGVARWLN
jgi:uncharacterized protein YgiM (DUF1202 family)